MAAITPVMTILASKSDARQPASSSPELYLNCLKVRTANETESTSPGEVESAASGRMSDGGTALALLGLSFASMWLS